MSPSDHIVKKLTLFLFLAVILSFIACKKKIHEFYVDKTYIRLETEVLPFGKIDTWHKIRRDTLIFKARPVSFWYFVKKEEYRHKGTKSEILNLNFVIIWGYVGVAKHDFEVIDEADGFEIVKTCKDFLISLNVCHKIDAIIVIMKKQKNPDKDPYRDKRKAI